MSLAAMARMRNFRSKPLRANPSARASSSSGWLGGLIGPISSIGSTSPRPRSWDQTRLAAAREKYGFSGVVSQSASTDRGSSL